MTEPSWSPDAFAVKPLYRCCRSMGGTSFLAWSGEVVCWCVRHLNTHRTWKSRRRHATRRVFVTLLVRCRHRRLATGVLQLLWTRRVWCCCRRSSTVVLHVVLLSRYPDTMQKGLAVLPRDPDIPCPEVTSSVQQLWPDMRVRSGLLVCIRSGLFSVFPHLAHQS